MSGTDEDVIRQAGRSTLVRLRTLVVLRWAATFGQIATIELARAVFDLSLPIGALYLIIGLSFSANLMAQFVFPENRWLSEKETLGILSFDLAQLAALLFLTGGLNNPFALLLLAPVTIGATVLRLRSLLFLCGLALVLTSLMFFVHQPLMTIAGESLSLPDIFLFGHWAAILIGIGFLAFYAWRVSSEINSMSDALLATQMALSREQKLTDLGGVVAAAAHELGTPLATIKLVSTELIDELAEHPDLADDAQLIREQADRCRDILRSMGRAGKDDLQMRQAPLDSVLREAAEPHLDRGKDIEFVVSPAPGGETMQPTIYRRPEIIHGMRNLIQNAVDFSRDKIWVEAHWTDATVSIRISDDGDGFSSGVVRRIGDPFVKSRRGTGDGNRRPGYEGMGLGLFIAKTLLERAGASLSFTNGAREAVARNAGLRGEGAIVEVTWRRQDICADWQDERGALGSNAPITLT